MTRQTKVENLRDMIVNLGHTPDGDTTSELLNQLETLVASSGGDITEAQVQAMVASAVEETVQEGTLSDDDMSEIFGE